ncbi:MAG: ATP-dependent DNA helicase RecQ [Bdellovibrionaceae bacterium]|nr:ATP-dependent DNA helicase RecQ [Pseudobdellovibrionaceae bacterium]
MEMILLLKEKFNLNAFRPGQQEIISAILNKRDVLAVLPTGGGKSLCFQYPAMFHQKLVIVISPLIALMKDQVRSLQNMGIPAGAIYSGQTEDEKRHIFSTIQKGGPYILYLSPERVQKEGFQQWITNKNIALFAIDEAHCVSQWGHDFREEYGQLNVLKRLRPDVPTLALTASATPLVLHDIARQIHLKNPEKRVHGFYRPNLYFQVELCENEDKKDDLLVQGIQQHPEGRIIVYCGTRKKTEEVHQHLATLFSGVGFYHAGLASAKRTDVQEQYMNGDLRILVATNAFGMGIDQANVRLVIHYHMPATIDALYQEMGRAGRDGHDSTCMMLYAAKDKGLQSYFIQSSDAPQEIKSSRWRNLDALVNYSESSECRHAEILTYYQDAQRISNCGHCDNCVPRSPRRITLTSASSVTNIFKDQQPKTKLEKAGSKKKSSALPVFMEPHQEARFQALKAWRRQKSIELDIPAFIIFSDRTLKELATQNPAHFDDLKNIHGIGTEKLERYGADIMLVLTES